MSMLIPTVSSPDYYLNPKMILQSPIFKQLSEPAKTYIVDQANSLIKNATNEATKDYFACALNALISETFDREQSSEKILEEGTLENTASKAFFQFLNDPEHKKAQYLSSMNSLGIPNPSKRHSKMHLCDAIWFDQHPQHQKVIKLAEEVFRKSDRECDSLLESDIRHWVIDQTSTLIQWKLEHHIRQSQKNKALSDEKSPS